MKGEFASQNTTHTICINKSLTKRIKKKDIIGEKSKTIPGPPKGDLWIKLRIGPVIGSVIK